MAIEKLQETVANFVNGPLGKFIDKIGILVGQAGTLKFLFTGIATIIGVKMLNGLFALGAPFSAAIAKTVAWAGVSTLKAVRGN